MIRSLPLAILLALAAPAALGRAQETAIRLNVRPMAAPRPALEYQLLPELRELNAGNPVQGYVRCFMEQHVFFFSKESVAKRVQYQSMPLGELPARELLDYGRSALRQADWAARLDAPDWQASGRTQTGSLEISARALGPLQVLAAALQVRFRAEVAARRFHDAVRTAKTMLALARHLGEHPTPVGNLVGLSVAHVTFETLEEMLQQPGAPNLYWALTDLPSPLVDLRKGLQGAAAAVAGELGAIRDDVPMTEAQLEDLVGRLSGQTGYEREQRGRPPRSLRAALKGRSADKERVRAARLRLVAQGKAPGALGKMSPAQVILLDAKRAYEIRRDDRLKLLGLAPCQIDALASTLRADGLFADLLPDVAAFRWQQAKLQQRIALLRHVEALRLYAAEHDGKLPAKLSDVALPLPLDPVTGKPFAYRVFGATAHLDENTSGAPGHGSGDVLAYEVTIARGPQ